MKLRDERKADFERREAEQKAKYRERMDAINQKSVAQRAARAEASEARQSAIRATEPSPAVASASFDAEGRLLPGMEQGGAVRKFFRSIDPMKNEKARIAAMTSKERQAYIEVLRRKSSGGGS